MGPVKLLVTIVPVPGSTVLGRSSGRGGRGGGRRSSLHRPGGRTPRDSRGRRESDYDYGPPKRSDDSGLSRNTGDDGDGCGVWIGFIILCLVVIVVAAICGF